jgi:hypothetical protein
VQSLDYAGGVRGGRIECSAYSQREQIRGVERTMNGKRRIRNCRDKQAWVMATSQGTTGPLLDTPWIKTLTRRPLVEVRRGISFDDEPVTEKGSVLALTAPSGRFVDVRFGPTPEAFLGDPQDDGGFVGAANAGTATIHLPSGAGGCQAYECMVRVVWTHPIDSSRLFKTDGADMYLLADGNVMEVGVFGTPGGQARMFKEYWIWPTLQSPPTYLVVELAAAADSDQDRAQGRVVRIDGHCQGVMQTSSAFWVERWQTQDDGHWAKDARSNTDDARVWMPCQWSLDASRTLGDSVELEGREWRVVEASHNP